MIVKMPEINKLPNQIGALNFVFKKTISQLSKKEQSAISKVLAFSNGVLNSLPLAMLVVPELFKKELKAQTNLFIKELEKQLTNYYLKSKLAKNQTEDGFISEVDNLDSLFRKLNVASEEIVDVCFEIGESEHGDSFAKEFHELREKYNIQSGKNIFL